MNDSTFDAIRNGDNQAFPLPVPDGDPREDGLSKREWLAGMAMQGLLANPGNYTAQFGGHGFDFGVIAEGAVLAADKTLAALAQPQEKSDG